MTKGRKAEQAQTARAKVTRRKFLGYGAVASAAAVVSPVLARASNNAAPEVKAFELAETTIADLQAGMQSGKWTARALVRKYLARIAE
ncbi:MAG TPA: twin-arginine translocation signal domain-containing protein, partial [Pyrinomonadaceae bacterium]|nr:twin-arginine translocation signal domain-containing protein [Pyrinomonadaceae bacterium]